MSIEEANSPTINKKCLASLTLSNNNSNTHCIDPTNNDDTVHRLECSHCLNNNNNSDQGGFYYFIHPSCLEKIFQHQLPDCPRCHRTTLQKSSSSLTTSATTTRRRSRKKSSRNSTTMTIGLPMFGSNHDSSHHSPSVRRSDAQNVPPSAHNRHRHRTNSMSSNASGSSSNSLPGGAAAAAASSPPKGGTAAIPEMDPMAENGENLNPVSGPQSAAAASSLLNFAGGGGNNHPARTKVMLDDRCRHDSGGSIFARRPDYASFNVLPRHKINSYHIKMEDECSIGNDETRIFILSSFASNKMNRVPCVVCSSVLTIYDRYPLLDGTFFLSPRQYNKTCVQVKYEGKVHFLTAVCMGCLEGWPPQQHQVHCRSCLKPWSGGHLILGTMYSYDIFAAMPCCAERLKCNNCSSLVIHPEQRFNFFSDYSQMVSCPNCGIQDAHFCKSLAIYVKRDEAEKIANAMQQQQQQQQQAALRVHRVNSA